MSTDLGYQRLVAVTSYALVVLLAVVASRSLAAQAPARSDTPQLPQIYFAFQVDKPVTGSPDNKSPVYPNLLRRQNIEGDVMVAFAVDTTGRAIMATFEVIKTNDSLFTSAVRDALPSMRFTPAVKAGQKVAQLVRMPFIFTLAPHDTGTVRGPRRPR